MRIDIEVELLKLRRTKIVATLGPASSSVETVGSLIDAGVDVFRLNLSHGSRAEHRELFSRVRRAAAERDKVVAILMDLAGPKIRVGRFEGGGIDLEEGEEVTVTTRRVEGRPGLIPSRYEALAEDVDAGDRILLDDGNMELRAERVQGREITCSVIHGGRLRDRKGMNLPGVAVSAPALTDQDRRDARFAVELGTDLLALSFVRRAADVAELRELVAGAVDHRVALVAKIEKPEALEEIDGILEVADGIMVARGDLGVELPAEDVPLAQEQLVDRAREANKPVIVATQMLESMIERSRPSRAEVSDVANAVRSGADAVMLSGETAVGSHPVEAVRIMDQIVRRSEGYLWKQGAFGGYGRPEGHPPLELRDAVARATASLSRELRVRSIVVLTRTGHTATVMAASRPAAPILAVTSDARVTRVVSLLWGVRPRRVEAAELADPLELCRTVVGDLELGAEGDRVLLVKGFDPDPARSTPSVTVIPI